ncbi:PP2C family serine/threonine-protein phosphatase [Mariniradius sediminis]|uniref:Protein phosphatase 2C domain-containing protein n=1 Tax=Mariniradius sediminis TaxID=2909237 RepID=A0ABS9BUW8_9BACT|nr:PP2C family serine/threonine-protein phosphatase [Mariniradius sediminis]MCF1751365.1 protein phosphatase 2C domain-containing protein [Mariniradius sediminis]
MFDIYNGFFRLVSFVAFALAFFIFLYLVWDIFKKRSSYVTLKSKGRIKTTYLKVREKETIKGQVSEGSADDLSELKINIITDDPVDQRETILVNAFPSTFGQSSLEPESNTGDGVQNESPSNDTKDDGVPGLDTSKNDKLREIQEKNENSAEESSSQALYIGNWIIVGGRSIGKSHRESGLPCQDNFFLSPINENSGIAVVCDGAGSAKNSQIGSKFVSERVIEIFGKIMETGIGLDALETISTEQWREWAKKGLYQVRLDLEDFGNKNGYSLSSLSCTVIVVIYHPAGILVTHIGDGRAGYLSPEKGWLPLIRPYKGEEANETAFITSKIWNEQDIDSFLEAEVFQEEYSAFTLMSDGCETHSYSCSIFDSNTNSWSDPNLPFSKFFDPLINGIKEMKKAGLTPEEIGSKWTDFLISGTNGLASEPDDKTLILAVSGL